MVDQPVPASAADERIALLEDALEATQNGILVLDLDRRIIRYNQQYLRMFSLTAEALDQRGTEAIVEALKNQIEAPAELVMSRADIWENPSLEIFDTVRFKDGRVFERFIAPRRNGGRIIGRVASFRDITSTVRTAQSQRLEAIGQLAGGIAHDLCNSLTAIIGYAELALNGLEEGHVARPDLQEVRRAAGRAESVTRQLLAFSRKQMLEPRNFSLADSISNLARMLDRLLGSGIAVRAIAPPDVPLIYGDPGQIEQAILNIAANARDAMPRGGRLTLALSVVSVDAGFTDAHRPMTPGRYVRLLVTDTGEGMSAEVRSHVFEPFFTTKEVGKGTGLGLAMVYGTVKQSGGYIFVESEEGRGSTFQLYFPPAEAEVASEVPDAAAELPANTTILVAEDESPIRNLVVTALRRKGYQVLHASSGHDALAIAVSEGRPIDLLLTDATMPGMSGLELASTLLRDRPEMAVIVMSGRVPDPLELGGLAREVVLLPKPFTPRELQQKISDVLVERRSVRPRL